MYIYIYLIGKKILYMHYNKIKKSFGLSSFKVLKGPNLIQPHRISSQAHSPLFIYFIYTHTRELGSWFIFYLHYKLDSQPIFPPPSWTGLKAHIFSSID